MTKSRAQMRIEQYRMQIDELNDKFRKNEISSNTLYKEVDKLDKKIQKLCLNIYAGKYPNK